MDGTWASITKMVRLGAVTTLLVVQTRESAIKISLKFVVIFRNNLHNFHRNFRNYENLYLSLLSVTLLCSQS